MATYYVWSGATGSATGADWTNAFTTMTAGYSAANSSGDSILVHKAHARALAADETWTAAPAHNMASPLKIIVVDKDNSDAPVADYTDMGTNGEEGETNNKHIQFAGSQYIWGMRFVIGDSVTLWTATNDLEIYENCGIILSSSTNEYISTAAESIVRMINSDLVFQGGGQHYLRISGDGTVFEAIGGAVTAANNGSYFINIVGQGASGKFVGVDLTGIDPSTTWVDVNSSSDGCRVEMQCCAFPASPPALASSDIYHNYVSAVNSGSTDGRYYSVRKNHTNTISHDTTTHRDSGSTYDGTNGYSFKVITSEVVDGYVPFRNLLAVVDGGSLSGKTITVHLTHDSTDNTNKIQNDEVWIEMTTLDDTSGAHFETTRALPTATPSDLTDDSSESWTSGETYQQMIDHTWAGGATSGLVYIYLCVAKAYAGGAGSSLFVCPKADIA